MRQIDTRYQQSVAVRVTASLLDRVRRAAAAREQRISELCRDAIREHLARIERGGSGGRGDDARD